MIPERYGGSFVDVMTYGVICEELARVDWVIASVVSVVELAGRRLAARFGTTSAEGALAPGDRRRASCICSACLTEPGGGTDLGNMGTTATRVDGGYRLTGTKVFISHAAHAGSSSSWRRSTAARSTRA